MKATAETIKPLALRILTDWAAGSEQHVHSLEKFSNFGPPSASFGPGYAAWGVQASWLYASAVATLGAELNEKKYTENGMKVLRYLCDSHHTGQGTTTDGGKWGRTWISVLGMERAFQGIFHLEKTMSSELRTSLDRLMVDECKNLLHHGNRGGFPDVTAGLWNREGKNSPESNIWNGTFLWRSAHSFPSEAEAMQWAERSHDYLINGISIPSDSENHESVAGKSVAERHVGANFFPNYALDHHGYLNVGYMVICLSNAAILYFDACRENFPLPASLHHHLRDLWNIVRSFLFTDGRLIRIGGDTRVRYAYCQEYILPVLLFAADQYQDTHALDLIRGYLDIIAKEQSFGNSGLFFEKRLGELKEQNPYYYTRLESDRACALAMICNYLPLVKDPGPSQDSFLASVIPMWCEEEHGAAMVRNEIRFASFSWRAQGLAQALCLPPDKSDLAEWQRNLTPVVQFIGKPQDSDRRLIRHTIASYQGGFVTSGEIAEGVRMNVEEGSRCTDQAFTRIAFAALPDGQTCVGFQFVVTSKDRITYTTSIKSLHLNVPNDLFNDFRRNYSSSGLPVALPQEDKSKPVLFNLPSNQLSIDEVLHLELIYGGDLSILKNNNRHDRLASLWCDEVIADFSSTATRHEADSVLVDLAFSLVSGEKNPSPAADLLVSDGFLRAVSVLGCDGKTYVVVFNCGTSPASFRSAKETLQIPPLQSRVGSFQGGTKEIAWLADFGTMYRTE